MARRSSIWTCQICCNCEPGLQACGPGTLLQQVHRTGSTERKSLFQCTRVTVRRYDSHWDSYRHTVTRDAYDVIEIRCIEYDPQMGVTIGYRQSVAMWIVIDRKPRFLFLTPNLNLQRPLYRAIDVIVTHEYRIASDRAFHLQRGR